MPLWLEWIGRHWFALILVAGIVAAIVFVYVNRKSLFYKE